MPETSRLKKAFEQTTPNPGVAVSRLKAAFPQRVSSVADFVAGISSPWQKLATAFSGDPEMRGLPPIPEAPDSLAGRVGEVVMESIMIGVPAGAALSSVTRAPTAATGIMATLRNIGADVGAGFRAGPKRFAAAEGGMGVTSGAGGYYAEQMFPDSDAARFVGEMLGGMAPAITNAAARGTVSAVDAVTNVIPSVGTAKRYFQNTWGDIARSVNAQTAGSRASQRFQRATGDQSPEQIIQSMDADILPEARQIMTPAQLSNNPGLLSLERSIINETDALRNKSEEQLVSLNNVITGSLRGQVPEDAARIGMEGAQRDYYGLLNERVRLAAQKADESVSRMIPELGAENANRIASREINKALDDAVAQENELFGRIDMKAIAPTTNIRSELSRLRREAGVAGADSIPPYAINLFTRNGSSFLGATTTVRELRQAQSRLRNIARNNRSGSDPDFNQARIADSLADAITEDLAMSQGDNPELIADAVAYSRAKNEIFRQGTVGKILRTASDSGDVVPEALTLEATLGLGGARGAQAVDEIAKMAEFTPGSVSGQLYQAMDSYVRSEFLKAANRPDGINLASANTFIKNNEALLNRFPAIRAQIEQAMNSTDRLAAAENLRKAGISTFEDPNVSKASIFIRKGPTAAFDGVLNARNAGLEAQKLVDLVSADTSGEALEGLKSGFMDYLVEKSSDGAFISGDKLLGIINSPKGKEVVGKLFNQTEQNRLNQIVRTAQRLDSARAARPSAEGISGDTISRSANMLLGVLGAAYGRQVSSNLGGATIQIPSMFADQFRQLGISGMVNPARRLIVDAIQDEKLFKQVLMAEDPENLSPEATRRFNAWAAGAAARYAMQDNETGEE